MEYRIIIQNKLNSCQYEYFIIYRLFGEEITRHYEDYKTFKGALDNLIGGFV